MKASLSISQLSNITTEKKIETQQNDPTLLPWLTIYLILIFTMFLFFYKALKTQKRKYNYYILTVFTILIILLFI